MSLNLFINATSIISTKCFCRFEYECFQSLLDFGTTQHVVGNKALLRNIEPINNISISGAFSKKFIHSVKDTLDLILICEVRIMEMLNTIEYFDIQHRETELIYFKRYIR
eukprot:snap_masked-scaffold_26-processed-gene-4.123-mRNA-1 protein AED:1.00 eAED:1.00 QI:0/0/0/0/1/1/2/0/109